MKKSMLFLFLVAMLVAGISAVAIADPVLMSEDFEIMPRYSYIQSVSVSAAIDKSTGKLSADVIVRTKEKCDMTVTTVLYQKNGSSWTPIKTWNAPAAGGVYTGTKWSFTNSTYVDTSETYKIETTAKVTSVEDGRSENGTARQSSIPLR